jgi:aspartyl-tRNA(Asn)/glutamyl-tRNA(Gln) amidotransferase subunit A
MDAPGPIARSVEDAALLLEVIAGPDPADAWTSARPVPRYRDALTGQVRGLVIGVVRELLDSPDTDPEVRDAVAAAARALERLGARVEPVSLPLVPRAGAVFMALADSDGAALHQGWLRDRAGEYDVGTRRRLLAASLIPAAILQEAQRARVLIRVQVLAALDRHDLLLAPAQPTPAPSIALAAAPITSGRAAAQRFFNRRSYSTPASLAGVPALSVPCGMSASGLPIGLQLIGRRYDEATVLRAAHAFEADSGWATRRPPLPRSA